MGEFLEDLIDNNDLEQDFLDSLDDDLVLRELILMEMESREELPEV